MAIVVLQGGAGGSPDTFQQGESFIAYDSFFLRSDASAVVDSEDIGQELDNGTSWFTYGGGWQTTNPGTHEITVSFSGVQVGQCYAIHKHNLFTLGLTVKLQTSPDGAVFTDVAGSEQTPGSNKTIFFVAAASQSVRFWRLVITGHTVGTLRIAQIFVGPVLQVFQSPQTGWSPPNLALADKILNSRADGGDFIGRTVVRLGSQTGFRIGPIPQAWVRQNWLPFMVAAEEHPFYYSWDNVNFADEVAYCYTNGPITKPEYTSPLHMNLGLDFTALQT